MDHESTDERDQTSPPPGPGVSSHPDEPPSVKDQNHSNDGRNYCPRSREGREWARFVVECLTLIAVAVYAGIAYKQWGEMIVANQNATKALISTQRAYVNVIGLDIVPVLEGDRHTFWRVSPIIQNSGSTPTKNMRWTATSGDYDQDFQKTGPRIPNLDVISINAGNPATLAPHQETRILIQEPIPVKHTQAIRDQKMRIYIHGAMAYNDFFSDQPHLTRYCYALWGAPSVTGHSGFSYSMCGGKSNCADEECEKANDQKRR